MSIAGDASAAAGAPIRSAGAASQQKQKISQPYVAGWDDVIGADEKRAQERFLPVTRYALIDRLTRPQAWPPGMADDVRRLFRYLDYWRQQNHNAQLMRLLRDYEPFAPDSDLFITRGYTEAERGRLQVQLREGIESLLQQANFVHVERERIEQVILTKDSYYGLDLNVDFQVFEELVIYYRGASVRTEQRRVLSRFMRKQEFTIPIFRRICMMFKLKDEARHVEDVARQLRISREEARKRVRRSRALIAPGVSANCIYIKLFKNLPRADIEMVFPNTEVKFRLRDKLWLSLTGSGALGTGLFGAAGKLAVAFSSPFAAIMAAGALGSVVVRQVANVINQKQRYLSTMAQNLYFHAIASNSGVLTTLAEGAAEEDFKEEILLYSVLAKENVNVRDLGAVDEAIEHYLANTFGIEVDFDVTDAYTRLKADGLVSEAPDGTLHALPPKEAAAFIDSRWDKVLDMLPDDDEPPTGHEVDQQGAPAET
ncbi:MAG: TMEM143 family protein [Hyphomicrobiaceae bacterium]